MRPSTTRKRRVCSPRRSPERCPTPPNSATAAAARRRGRIGKRSCRPSNRAPLARAPASLRPACSSWASPKARAGTATSLCRRPTIPRCRPPSSSPCTAPTRPRSTAWRRSPTRRPRPGRFWWRPRPGTRSRGTCLVPVSARAGEEGRLDLCVRAAARARARARPRRRPPPPPSPPSSASIRHRHRCRLHQRVHRPSVRPVQH